jgi:hypothetical protein
VMEACSLGKGMCMQMVSMMEHLEQAKQKEACGAEQSVRKHVSRPIFGGSHDKRKGREVLCGMVARGKARNPKFPRTVCR